MSEVEAKISESLKDYETRHTLTQENSKFIETEYRVIPFEKKPSQYKYSKVVPYTDQKISFSGSSTASETSFRITTTAHNIAQSFIQFDVSFADTAELKDPGRIKMIADCGPFIQRIKATTEKGESLCYLENIDKYLKIIQPRQTSMKEYLNSDPASLFYPSDESKAENFLYSPTDGKMDEKWSAEAKAFVTGTSAILASTNYIENKHIINGVYNPATDAKTSSMTAPSTISFPLSAIKNSFFSIDKTIQMTSNYTIDITFGNPAAYLWICSEGSPLPYTGTVTLSNICLYLAVEENEDSINLIKNRLSGNGLRILCPYVEISKKTASAASTQHIQTIELNKSKAPYLRRILISPFQYNKTTAPLANETSITPGTTIVSFYSQFNNKRIQNFDIDVSKHMDWILYRKQHPYGDDAIPSRKYFYWNYAIEEVFDKKGCPLNNNVHGGLQLTNEQYTYDLIMTTTNTTFDFYRFVIYERFLVIKDGSVTWE